jgi:hypothetical protein
MGHPWPVNELRTSCAHPLRGLILRNLAATDGAPGEAGGFLPPDATATAPTIEARRGASTEPSYRRRPVSSFSDRFRAADRPLNKKFFRILVALSRNRHAAAFVVTFPAHRPNESCARCNCPRLLLPV